jgi:hypothetical protein
VLRKALTEKAASFPMRRQLVERDLDAGQIITVMKARSGLIREEKKE